MAYAAAASLSQTIHLFLNYHQHSISPRFKYQIVNLQKHNISLQSFLEDSPDRAYNWEETIREVTDRAEDIIELLLYDSLLESAVGSSGSKFKKAKFEVRYGFDDLERVTEEMELIAKRVKGGRRIEAMVGSDEELMEIISRLRGGSSSLERIAIYGAGGIGKTTLARKAYNDPSIVEHFDVRAWSTVTSDYDLQMIADLLRSMKGESISVSASQDELIDSLYENLRRRRYLIVIDDPRSLVRLNTILPDYGNGSRIILTTRSLELARKADHVHEMGSLDEDTTWNLLQQKIFEGDPCPSQLESVGKMIATSCRGHPLCIEVVSGILAADQTEAAWEDISENIKIAASQDGDDPLFHILYLSYTYLPHHLRPCFLYLGIWPEDEEIHVSKLIKLWVAEGFLNESGSKIFEETGEEYVEDLTRRSLVSVSKRKSNGRIKSITIHDLMRELCLRQACTDNFNLHIERQYGQRSPQYTVIEEVKSCRRASNVSYNYDFLKGIYGSTVRTINLYLKYGRLSLRCWMGNVRLLRILDLLNVYNYDLSGEVFELFHVRYLAFRHWFSIPEAISNLENLQTLIIGPREYVGVFDVLPEGIWRMPQLRHLLIFPFKFPSQKGAMPALENLQSLSRVVNFICSRENLKMIPNLKKLALLYTDDNLRDEVEDYELQNLIYLQKLEIFKIEMDWSSVEQHKMSYAFPPTLKKLNLCGLQLSWEDMKIVASLPNLEVLKLRKHACVGKTWETGQGGFCQLTYLLIEESNLENWIAETSHFPKLKCLLLHRCLHLLEVPNVIGKIPTLVLIELDGKNHSLLRSARQIQEDRQSLGYDPLHIRAV